MALWGYLMYNYNILYYVNLVIMNTNTCIIQIKKTELESSVFSFIIDYIESDINMNYQGMIANNPTAAKEPRIGPIIGTTKP